MVFGRKYKIILSSSRSDNPVACLTKSKEATVLSSFLATVITPIFSPFSMPIFSPDSKAKSRAALLSLIPFSLSSYISISSEVQYTLFSYHELAFRVDQV